MNELTTLLENFQYSNEIKLVYLELKTWLMEMSILNLIGLVFILWMSWTFEAKATRSQEINGVSETKNSNIPKYLILVVVFYLTVTFPDDLFWASSVYLLLIGMVIWWQKPLLTFILWFQPKPWGEFKD